MTAAANVGGLASGWALRGRPDALGTEKNTDA